MKFFGLAISALTLVTELTNAFECGKIDVNGTTIDLTSIDKDFDVNVENSTPPTKNKISYAFNPCKPLKQNSGLPEADRCKKDAWACRSVTNIKNDESRIIEVSAIASEDKNNSPRVFWEMKGQEFLGSVLNTKVELVCKENEVS
ncbi:hypothetical protein AYI69_g2508 [Smittium culicis]|uniref:Uncharacterized protein n=1 Tax=Smittium culicis TaxID=133412 RepID=A0A1R1YMH8_9FUNG|nr:hypothetical protein AYI69_g2508 [Smittium culicis]